MYLDGFGKFLTSLVENFFLPMFKNFWAKKSIFGDISKKAVFRQKSDYVKRFLVKFPFFECILLYTVIKLGQNLFSQNATKL